MGFIPYGRQDISEQDVEAVMAVLRSDWITQGPAIEHFEHAVANYCEVRYAVAVSSSTAALHIACLAADVGSGELVWTSPNTFVASANCSLYCNAEIDFVDIDSRTYNLSVDALSQKIKAAEKDGNLPTVLIPVHLAGQSCEMAQIAVLAEQYGFTVIEDASHAIGAAYQGKPIGGCAFSEMTVFSFHPVKIMTTGEGGMILTNQEVLYNRLIRLRSHGITRNPDLMTEPSHGPWYYQQLELGVNYRMTDIQAALGLSQLQRLDAFVARRSKIAARYNKELANLPLTLPWQHPDTLSSWHLYIVRLQLHKLEKSHRQVFEKLRQLDIGVNLHYIPVHTQPYYQQMGFQWGDFPVAEQYYQEAISLPIYYGLTDTDQERVIEALTISLS